MESCSLSMSLDIDEMEPEWLPMMDLQASDIEASPNATVLPLFPLGSFVYTPHSEHRLNIFEPRYRALYNDILFSGFAAVASVFYLKDLKEVSAATNDAVKYICDHEVIGRIRIKKVLNPKVWEDRSTYLKVEAEYIEDKEEPEGSTRLADMPDSMPELEKKLVLTYNDLVQLQHEMNEDVKFTKESVDKFKIAKGQEVWSAVEMWQVFQQQRLLARQQEMQKEFQAKLLAYLIKEKGMGGLPNAIDINELPANLQQEVRSLQARMQDDLQPLAERDMMDMQLLIECDSHSRRLELMDAMLTKERKRLETKKTLKSLFNK
ncbi:hypothetical protein GUITHDRAFT_107764 [Guillardia theta CCMP2712]|uniref:Lon N-terminal domain-containing protein n=1 Tax=Guillardia theta (strain CCMP2712) TaxID=905079 RepID=L1JEM5_GUITC|nr:hypothetical protein GUITHDRAFT_107764 [Guillardia theta CCMP2712]EKX46560.1 hypothetical protein GUITHDRAFT_107764 [Guillardia theta CCMP2712]|eukprot:XP_005833540.1 hypothetical protein GUITHDRAFT_107764 [Guillardia theta CCMP2712]